MGFKERQDLQEWVLEHPSILGDNILIITSEFAHWQTAVGERALNRLDILGLDAEGTLVVAELKRDKAPNRVHLQAITYAAMVSMFSEDHIVREYHRFHSGRGREFSEEDALREILEHAGELDEERLRNPRIVLVAGEFSEVTTSSVVWLSELGIDISLQQVQAYQIPTGELILTVSQLFPVPVVDDLRISPGRREVQKTRERQDRRRQIRTVTRILRDGLLAEGTELITKPTNEIGSEERERVAQWLEAHPEQGRATWTNTRSTPLLWAHDGQQYAPTTIVSQVVREATGLERPFQGPRWWRTPDGRSLPEVAQNGISDAAFDWDPLHDVLEAIPPGRWASYGDIAAMIDTAAQPLGNHLAACSHCENAWRVLTSDGRSSQSFSWSDPARQESQQSVLEREGIRFSGAGQADPSARLTAEELSNLLPE